MDVTADRDARRFRVFIGAFVAASVFLTVAVVAAINDDGRLVPSATRALSASAAAALDALDATATTVPAGSGGGTGASASAVRSTVTKSAPLKKGEEIVVGSVVSESGAIAFPQVAAVLRSYFADLNARGGINGHPVRLELLDDGLDTNRSRQEFKQLAEDPKMVAVVGSFAPLGEPDGAPMLEDKNIPMVTASGLAPNTFSMKYMWFLTSTLENYGRVGCAEALRRGQKRVALVYISSEQVAPIISGYEKCISDHGGAFLDEPVQLGQPDYTTTALRIGQFRADVVFHELAQSASVQLWQAMDRQGVVAANQLVPGSDIPIILNYDGAAGRDVTIQTNVLPPHVANPAMARIKAAMAKYQPGVEVTSLAVDKWVGAELFTLAATQCGDTITRECVQAAMGKVTSFSGDGLMPAVSYSPMSHTTQGLFYFFDKTKDGWGPVGAARGPA